MAWKKISRKQVTTGKELKEKEAKWKKNNGIRKKKNTVSGQLKRVHRQKRRERIRKKESKKERESEKKCGITWIQYERMGRKHKQILSTKCGAENDAKREKTGKRWKTIGIASIDWNGNEIKGYNKNRMIGESLKKKWNNWFMTERPKQKKRR